MRLVTRGDMDGLTCAVLISQFEPIDEFVLIHPQDITDKRVEIKLGDILANVPYHPNCGLWFDHHTHTATYRELPKDFKGKWGKAASTARLVYEYYGWEKLVRFEDLVRETDRMDSADLSPEDVTDPKGYVKLGFTLDSRTGLGAFQDYMMTLYDLLRKGTPIDKVLEHPAVKRRWQTIHDGDAEFRKALVDHSKVDGNVVVTDFRGLERVPVGNRFLVYAVFPDVNVSVRVHWGPARSFVVAALGHSIFNRTCPVDVGQLAAKFGGGGHRGAASVPLPPDTADAQLAEIVAELKRG
jgi:hypothetical protein